jgi:hypothetical protein
MLMMAQIHNKSPHTSLVRGIYIHSRASGPFALWRQCRPVTHSASDRHSLDPPRTGRHPGHPHAQLARAKRHALAARSHAQGSSLAFTGLDWFPLNSKPPPAGRWACAVSWCDVMLLSAPVSPVTRAFDDVRAQVERVLVQSGHNSPHADVTGVSSGSSAEAGKSSCTKGRAHS